MQQVFHFVLSELILRLEFVDDAIGHALFGDLTIVDAFLHRVIGDQTIDETMFSLSVTINSTDRLGVQTRIPRHVHDDDAIRRDQIDAQTTGPATQTDDERRRERSRQTNLVERRNSFALEFGALKALINFSRSKLFVPPSKPAKARGVFISERQGEKEKPTVVIDVFLPLLFAVRQKALAEKFLQFVQRQ